MVAILAGMSSAKSGTGQKNSTYPAADTAHDCGNFGRVANGGLTGSQITISQPPHDIMPLDDVLADVKPHECGSLVGVRLMQHRSLEVYRLRILKDTGGVIDLYVNARTGVPL
jgi:hypothetical protein